jgi:hypothetical protein
VVVAHDDEGLGENVSDIERCLIAKRRRRVVDALAADRRLVEDESERLMPGADGAERWRGGFDIGNARAPPEVSMIVSVTPRRSRDCNRCSISPALYTGSTMGSA